MMWSHAILFFRNFTLVQTTEYGNCYTIQSDSLVTQPGPDHGKLLVWLIDCRPIPSLIYM